MPQIGEQRRCFGSPHLGWRMTPEQKARQQIDRKAELAGQSMHFDQKANLSQRSDLNEFVDGYRPGNRHLREPTWSEATPEGRWRSFAYDDLMKRDKVNLDIFWLKDKTLEDSDDLPTSDVLVQEIADDLQTVLGAVRGKCREREGMSIARVEKSWPVVR